MVFKKTMQACEYVNDYIISHFHTDPLIHQREDFMENHVFFCIAQMILEMSSLIIPPTPELALSPWNIIRVWDIRRAKKNTSWMYLGNLL